MIGGGAWFATKDGGDKHASKPQADSGGAKGGPVGSPTAPAAHKSELAYLYGEPAAAVAKKDDLKDALGIWFTDRYVVKNEVGQVVGYDIDTGARAWSIAAPSGTECTAARDQYDNMTAIQYGADCDKVMAIDLAAGRELWTEELPSGDPSLESAFDFSEMAISGDAVGVDWTGGSVAYRLSDHKELWRSGAGRCDDDGYAGGAQFVGVVECDLDTYKVQVVDPARNGAAKWSWTAPSGLQVSAIVSTDPVVVLLGTDDNLYTDVAVLDNGRLRSRISLGRDTYLVDADGAEKQAVHDVLVDKDTVYLALDGRSDSGGKTVGGVAAFDLGDGKPKWVARTTGGYGVDGIGFQDGRPLAYEAPDYGRPGRLVTLDPATGSVTPYATLGQDAFDKLDNGGLHNYYVWHGGRLYFVSKTIYSDESGQTYFLVYG